MSASRLRLAFSVCFVALSCGMTLPLAGCGSGNPNENEFPAPPGRPSEFPDETVSQRRARTLRSPEKIKAEKAEELKSGANAGKTP
jgi:hypothetical protein